MKVKKNFGLFMCRLGNGLTICNSAVMENGDYKHIAHIAECGKIKWYVDPVSYIPEDALSIINKNAEDMHTKWINWLDRMPELKRYEILLDNAPHAAFMYVVRNKEMSIAEICDYLKAACYNEARF